ncbi:hypothetical protein BOX15_Mlig019754g1 [Macrostomum lignano]|uniref:Uncharacterized protein n=1 Tax=Macrostomum lignano TaxID=282301 RepID=A0A267G539_9PLAT|nr:hypothetical protein BOX15_Mlig019754g1 [Macrostomum lignano]
MPGNEPSAEPTEDELISALASNNSGAVQSIISGGKCVDHFIVYKAHHSTRVSSATKCEYHEIYDVLLEAMRRLPAVDGNAESLMDLIDKLPDCARSARESVRAIICLQLGKRDAAADILKSLKGFSASRGIDWPAERSASEATVEFVLQHYPSATIRVFQRV